MLSVMGAFVEFERALIGERQRESIAPARKHGAYRGRKKALSPDRIAELRQRVTNGEQKAKLAREFGICRETLYQRMTRSPGISGQMPTKAASALPQLICRA